MKTTFHFELDQALRLDWDRFWQNCEHTHPRQHSLFGQIERAQGRTPIYAIGRTNGSIKCAGLFSIRPLFSGKRFSPQALCLRGPAFDNINHCEQFLLQTESHFKKLNTGCISLCPYWFYPQAKQVEDLLHNLGFTSGNGEAAPRSTTGLVDLQRSDEEILAEMKSKTRQEIRRTDRLGVSIRPARTLEEAKHFYRQLSAMHRQRSLDAITFNEFKATFEYILKDQQLGILLNAFYDEQFLSGLWLVRGTHTCHYARFVVVRSELKKLANLTIGPALWWHGIQWAKEKGCTTLNVEGYRNDVEPYHPKYHLYKLKGRFNPKPADILAPHLRVCSPIVYKLHKQYKFCLRTFNFLRATPYRFKTWWTAHKGASLAKGQKK